jgi:RimJ/RimL family protein N-acetyltransferase
MMLRRVGARVQLRRLRAEDLSAFQTYRRDPALARYQSWSAMNDEDALSFLQEMAEAPFCTPGVWMQLAIASTEDGRLLGDIGLHRRSPPSQTAELGYTLSSAWQGRGLASEAAALAIDLLWSHTDVDAVEACTDSRNHASERLLLRLGFQCVSKAEAVFHGEACIEHLYRLSRPPRPGVSP